jgi:hypothetical protein
VWSLGLAGPLEKEDISLPETTASAGLRSSPSPWHPRAGLTTVELSPARCTGPQSANEAPMQWTPGELPRCYMLNRLGMGMRRLMRHHSTGQLASPVSMSPPETPPALRMRGVTEGGSEATKLLLPQGPLSVASSADLALGVLAHGGLEHCLCAQAPMQCMPPSCSLFGRKLGMPFTPRQQPNILLHWAYWTIIGKVVCFAPCA